MFSKRALPVTGSTLIRNKEVKKLRDDVKRQFPLVTEDDLLVLIPAKAQVKKIKFQAPCRIVVFLIQESNLPILFDSSGKNDLCPTVYALWLCPKMIRWLVINDPVSEFIMRGADVMIPGTVATAEERQTYKKNEIRAVVTVGNPIPMAVGKLLVDGTETTGKGLEIMHVFYDHLWEMGPKTIPNEGFQVDQVVPHTVTPSAVDVVSECVEELTIEDHDQVIQKAFFRALKTELKPKHLPLRTNEFYSKFMLPSRPAGSTIQLKQSSYKKLSTFLNEMSKLGICEVQGKDGVDSLTFFRRNHDAIQTLAEFQTQAEREQVEIQQDTAETLDYKAGEYAPQVMEYYKPTPRLDPILNRQFYTVSELKEALLSYIELKGLGHTAQQIRLDPELTDALLKRKKKPEGGYPTHLDKAEALKLLIQQCQAYYSVKFHPDHEPAMKRGQLHPIQVRAEKRMGNKRVTIVSFLEPFGIHVSEFAAEAQKEFAASCTSQAAMNGNATEEVMIQGQFVTQVGEYLKNKLKIPKEYITMSWAKGVSKKK